MGQASARHGGDYSRPGCVCHGRGPAFRFRRRRRAQARQVTRVRGGFILLPAAASTIIATAMGIRQSFGVFLQPIILDLALTRDVFGPAAAIQNLARRPAPPALAGAGAGVAVGRGR